MCSWYSTYTRHAFTYLVNRGANVNARDDTGATCLHLAIENAKRPQSGELEALAYLLDQGADVHATTAQGMSVSEVAYTTSSTDVVYKLGSYRGDLWDAVLAGAGYDVVEFRRGWPREEKFTSRYTSSHLRELWMGREHLCPYFSFNGNGDDAALQITDGATADVTATVSNFRPFEISIRQRTDISVTIDSVENLNLSTQDQEQYDQYEGSCVASHSLSVVPVPSVPLLWDPSLAHHLMPNPWHDIISQDSESMGTEGEVSEGFSSTFSIADKIASEESQGAVSKRIENNSTSVPFCWDIEIENVWND